MISVMKHVESPTRSPRAIPSIKLMTHQNTKQGIKFTSTDIPNKQSAVERLKLLGPKPTQIVEIASSIFNRWRFSSPKQTLLQKAKRRRHSKSYHNVTELDFQQGSNIYL